MNRADPTSPTAHRILDLRLAALLLCTVASITTAGLMA